MDSPAEIEGKVLGGGKMGLEGEPDMIPYGGPECQAREG